MMSTRLKLKSNLHLSITVTPQSYSINQSIKVICNARNVVHKLESEARSSNLNYSIILCFDWLRFASGVSNLAYHRLYYMYWYSYDVSVWVLDVNVIFTLIMRGEPGCRHPVLNSTGYHFCLKLDTMCPGWLLLHIIVFIWTRYNLTLMSNLVGLFKFCSCWYFKFDFSYSEEGRVCYGKSPDPQIPTILDS